MTETSVSETDITVHIRGGTIIPERVASANTTAQLRKQDLTLTVAPDADGKAKGRLYLDDGESLVQDGISEIDFAFDNGKFSSTGSFGYKGKSGESITIKNIVVLGQNKAGSAGTFDSVKGSVEIEGPWNLGGSWGFQI